MSWEDCMYDKIKKEWGHEAANCVKGFSKSDLEKIAKCIVGVVETGINFETVLAKLGEWSVECLF